MGIDPQKHAAWLAKHGQSEPFIVRNPIGCVDPYHVPTETDPVKLPAGSGYNPKVVSAWFLENKLPAPSYEIRFHPIRDWRFDLAWLPQRVAVEVQGGIWTGGGHVRGAQLVKEFEKLSEAACLGWRVLFCQPDQLCTVEFADQIRRALEWDYSKRL